MIYFAFSGDNENRIAKLANAKGNWWQKW